MCPPLSCCHARHAGPLPTLLYHLQRLLLASAGNEQGQPEPLTATQRRHLPARLHALWHQALSGDGRQRPGACPALVEHVLPALLAEPCCCQAVRERVSLAEALGRGFRGSRRWARRAARLRLRVAASRLRLRVSA